LSGLSTLFDASLLTPEPPSRRLFFSVGVAIAALAGILRCGKMQQSINAVIILGELV
jgi:hypothetical protein